MTPKEVIAAKEGGRHRLLCLRFPRFYGYDRYFICRTLTRGEIHRAYQSVGYQNLSIPKEDRYAQTLLENCIFEKATLSGPPGVTPLTVPAGLVPTISRLVLNQSHFIDGTVAQNNALRAAIAYADSHEGRNEAAILHYLQGVSEESLMSEPYDHMFRRTFQAILVAGHMGVDLTEFLKTDDEMMSNVAPGPRPFIDYNPHTQAPPRSPRPAPKPKTQMTPQDRQASAVAALKRAQTLTPQINRMLGLAGESVESSQPFMFMSGEVVDNVKRVASQVNKHVATEDM